MWQRFWDLRRSIIKIPRTNLMSFFSPTIREKINILSNFLIKERKLPTLEWHCPLFQSIDQKCFSNTHNWPHLIIFCLWKMNCDFFICCRYVRVKNEWNVNFDILHQALMSSHSFTRYLSRGVEVNNCVNMLGRWW